MICQEWRIFNQFNDDILLIWTKTALWSITQYKFRKIMRQLAYFFNFLPLGQIWPRGVLLSHLSGVVGGGGEMGIKGMRVRVQKKSYHVKSERGLHEDLAEGL